MIGYISVGLDMGVEQSSMQFHLIFTCGICMVIILRFMDMKVAFGGAESLMRKVWEETKMLLGVYSRFKHEPHLSGFAGAVNHAWITANNYDGLLAKIKRLVRQLVRYVMPWLWI